MEMTLPAIEIRRDSARELYSITVLTRRFFPYMEFGMRQIEERLKDDSISYYVALAQGCTIGYVDFKEARDSIDVMGVAVLDEFQGKGVGTRLLEVPVREARRMGKPRVNIFVSASNAKARQLYEKNGFELKGKLPHQVFGRDVLVMSKLLAKE